MAAGNKGDSTPYPLFPMGGVGIMGVLLLPAAATRCRCNCCALWYSMPGPTPETSAAAMEDREDDELDWLVDVKGCCCHDDSPLMRAPR